ncbi:MAG: phage holin family protein [Cytophagaceae bacterium]|nr:phage holin family protein [Cytophagaceae bacterium]
MDLQDVKSRAEDFYEHVTNYLEARYNLAVLETSDKLTNVLSSVAAGLIVGVVGLIGLLFASVGIALWIGQSTDNNAAGFFWVAFFYAVVGAVVYAVRNKVIKIPVMNALVKKFYHGTKN